MGRRKAAVESPSPLLSQDGVRRALSEHFLLRLHMTVILGGTVGAGLAVTHLLLAVHLNNLAVRYGIAIFAAFGAFIVFVRSWLWYVGFCAAAAAKRAASSSNDWFNALNFSSGGIDVPSFGGGSSDDGPSLSGGGGKFGGGGASGGWGEPSGQPVLAVAAPQASSGSGGKGSGFSIPDLGDDMGVVVLAIVLVVAIAAAAFYLIYAAPVVLSEAAFQAALAATLARHAKKMTSSGWIGSILRSTAIPFLIVLAIGVTLGWYAQKRCPSATRLHDAMYCAGRQ